MVKYLDIRLSRRILDALDADAHVCLSIPALILLHVLLTCVGMRTQVRAALDGRHIPRHLLGDAPNPPSLKIAYSQHTDLNVKFQSHRSRYAPAPALPSPGPCPR